MPGSCHVQVALILLPGPLPGNQFIRQRGRCRTLRHDVFTANQLPGLFKDGGRILRGQSLLNARPMAGFAVIPLVESEPPHTVPTTSSFTVIGVSGNGFIAASVDSTTPAPFNGLAGSARLLNHQRIDRPSALPNRLFEICPVKAFATQRDQQDRPNIR